MIKKVNKSKIEVKNIIICSITFLIVAVMSFMSSGNNMVNLQNPQVYMYFILFLVGVIAAATMVIPGVSGSFVLMLIGFYKPIVKVVSNLTDFSNLFNNLLILIPFGVGVLVGIILVAKLIEFLFNKYEISTYYAILGFVFASFIGLIKSIVGVPITTLQVFIAVILFITATLIGYKLGDS